MRSLIKLILINFIYFYFYFSIKLVFSRSRVGEILEIIQKDLRTLERAVYSQSFSENSEIQIQLKKHQQKSQNKL